MPSRNGNTGDYRYGFNGMESDDEVKGVKNSYDFGERIYDPRISKFLSRDPLEKSFPWYTPYQYAGNMPISAVDLDGLEIFFAADGSYIGKWGTKTNIRVVETENVESFSNDLQAAYDSPDDWLAQDAMKFYWSGSAGSKKPSMSDKGKILVPDVIPSSTACHYKEVKDCYKAATETLLSNGYVVREYWKEKHNELQMYQEKKNPSKLSSKEKEAITKKRLNGFAKLNAELEKGKPVLVGIDHTPKYSSNKKTDNTTDHFIVITGRGIDSDGNLYYKGFENVYDGNDSDLNRFYMQENGTLKGSTIFTEGTITQIRLVEKIKDKKDE